MKLNEYAKTEDKSQLNIRILRLMKNVFNFYCKIMYQHEILAYFKVIRYNRFYVVVMIPLIEVIFIIKVNSILAPTFSDVTNCSSQLSVMNHSFEVDTFGIFKRRIPHVSFFTTKQH